MATDENEAEAIRKEKLRLLQSALDKIEQNYGKGAVMLLNAQPIDPVEVIPTGSIGLDNALGVGGFPRGRIVEIFGPEASGKTTLAFHAIAECQKQGGNAALIDAEHAFDSSYAKRLGVNLENLLVSQPENGEQALDIVDILIRSEAMDIIVIDSVAALAPKDEISGEMSDSQVGLHARLMSQAMRKMTANISRTKCCCMFINQLREKIGVLYGNPEYTTGGNALKFFSSVRVDIRRVDTIKEVERTVGNRVRVRVVKNKVSPPFQQCDFDIIFGEGISKMCEIIDMGVDLNIIQKSGTWLGCSGKLLAQGRTPLKQVLTANAALADELEQKIRAALAERRGKTVRR